MHCILTTSKEYQELKAQSSLDDRTLKAKIMIFQEDNGLDKWPTLQELSVNNEFLQTDLAIPLKGNEKLYKHYNLLNEKGAIKNLSWSQAESWVKTLNGDNVPYRFKHRQTEGGLKILIYPKNTLLQREGTVESPIQELNEKLNVFLSKLGVSVETLGEGDFVAKAKILEKIIQVVQGKADVSTLPEEASHFFVELLDKNSTLYKQMYAQIEATELYRSTYEEYKEIYTLDNGSSDIDKIKREAIAKLIAQNIVTLYKTNKSDNWFTRAWNIIVAAINKGLKAIGVNSFNQFIAKIEGKDIFIDSAKKVLEGDISELSSTKLNSNESNYEMLQLSNSTQNDIVSAYNKIQSRIEVFNEKEGLETIHGYYVDKGTKTEKKVLVTPSYIAGTDRRKKNSGRAVDEATQAVWDKNMREGTEIHSYIEDYVNNIKFSKTPVSQTTLYQSLSKEKKLIYESVAKQADEVIENIKKEEPGSIFLPEVKIYDPSYVWVDEKGKRHVGIAGSIDLLVIHSDGTVSIYDWKTVNKKGADINVLKYAEYSHQVALYKRMLMDGNYSMGIPKIRGIKKTRLIPFEILRDYKTGDIKSVTHLMQVPVSGEKGANKDLNDRVEAIYSRFYKMVKSKPPAGEAEKTAFYFKLENIKDMLITLQLKQSYNTILEQAADDLHSILTTLSKEDVTTNELQEALEITEMYTDIMEYADLTAMSKEVKKSFETLTGEAVGYKKQIRDKIEQIQISNAEKYGIDNLLKTQQGIGWVGKTFNSISQINHPMIAYLHEMAKESLVKTEQETNEFREEVKKEIKNLSDWAKSKGLTLQQAYDKLVNKSYGGLVNQYSKEFREAKKKAIKDNDETWLLENLEIDKEAADKSIAKYTEGIRKRQFSANAIKNKKIQDEYIENYRQNAYSYFTPNFVKVKKSIEEKWFSNEWKEIIANKPLLNFYNFFTSNTKKFSQELPTFNYTKTFIPNAMKTIVEEIATLNNKSGKNLMDEIKNLVSVNSDTKQGLGIIEQDTGTQGGQIPAYFINNIDPSKKSYDLGKVLQMFGEMTFNYKNMSEIEADAVSTLTLLKGQKAYEVSTINGKVKVNTLTQNKIESLKANENWIELYETFNNYFLYGVKTKDATKFTEFINQLNSFTAFNMLGLSAFPALAAMTANVFNTSVQAARGTFFTSKQEAKALWLMSGGGAMNLEDRKIAYGFLQLIQPHIDNRKFAKDRMLSSTNLAKAATIDHFFIGLRAPDMFNQAVVCLSILQNSTFDEKGNIVLIDKYLSKPVGYYSMSKEGRAKADAELKEKRKNIKSVYDMGKIVDGEFVVEGHEDLTNITNKTINDFRQFVRQVNKNIIGNVDPDDVSDYRTNTYARALMLFRNWMPRMFMERYGELRYNRELHQHEWGRYKTFWTQVIKFNRDEANRLRWNLLIGVEKAAVMEYEKMIAKDPEIADEVSLEEYVGLYKSNMKASYRGLAITAGLILLMYFSGKYFDDDNDLTGGEKVTARMIKRAYSEMAMFANPLEAINILKSPSASMQPLVTFSKAMTHSAQEIAGFAINDEEMMQKAKPLKYWMGFSPFANVEKMYRNFDETWQEAIEDNKVSE